MRITPSQSFLDRNAIIESVSNILNSASLEIVIVAPYIKLSEHFSNLLKNANDRGIEITIVYREDRLHKNEKQRLMSFENLTLLCHPDIHAKCYFNEYEMVITSMNLYDYSEKYNREMGVLVANQEFAGDTYRLALKEVREIVQTARLEKRSAKVSSNGFRPQLLQPEHEKLFASCVLINRLFDNKKFEVIDNTHKGEIRCKNYYEKIDVVLEPDFSKSIDVVTGEFSLHRVALDFRWDESKLERIHDLFFTPMMEYQYTNYKIYWDYHKSNLTIYRDKRGQPKWDTATCEQTLRLFKNGIEQVIADIRKVEMRLR
ncbi:phospholipase D-like domain-containing protein [Flaviaesturariibacter amylovorans]